MKHEVQRPLDALQERLNLRFRRPELLEEAFTHSTWVNEHKTDRPDNERLEFLGDSVLGLAVAEYLFLRYPGESEGELTRRRAQMVCEPSLSEAAERLGFGAFLLLGRGEEQTGGRRRPALLADVFEAFIGALFLDQGLDAVRGFLAETFFPYADGNGKPAVTDFKTRLQEHTQHLNLGTPEYRLVSESGPPHDRRFVSEVVIGGRSWGTGSGRSKKESEQQAAKAALEAFGLSVFGTGRDASPPGGHE